MQKIETVRPIQAAEPDDLETASRRDFVKGSAVLFGTLASGSLLAALAPTRAWAAEMKVLDDKQAKFLLRLTQVIFPHKNMPDAINALAVKDLDKAAEDAAVAKDFNDGMAALDNAAGGDWLSAAPEKQAAAVKENTDLPLFQKVRGQCITSLYNNELAFRHFNYPGEAYTKGGYLARGFDDLSWLPNPPADASPTAFGK